MNDFEHRMPSKFVELREQWQGDGGQIPYECKLGTVDIQEVNDSTFFVGRIGDMELILHVAKTN